MMTEHFDCLFEVTKIVLILSYGNVQVKSGFSINNHILVENLHKSSIVVQCQIYNGIVHVGGVRNVEITNSVVKIVNMSHSCYKDDLKIKKRKVKGRRSEHTEMVSCPKIKDLKVKKASLSLNHQ